MSVYLLQNESKYILDDKILNIIKDETNIIKYDYILDGLEMILEEASYLSLFDERKIIIVKNAICFGTDKLDEDLAKNLEAYLNNPNPNTILIFTISTKIDERKKIVKIIKEKYYLEIIPKLNSKELITKVIDIFKNRKMKIDYDTTKYICETSLYNYDLIYNEIDKIAMYYDQKPATIELVVVQNLVSKNIENNIFKFSDAVIKKDFKKMFNIFNDLKLIKQEPIVIINSLAREYRLMLKVSVMLENKYSRSSISKELKLQDWLCDKIIQNSYQYRIFELKEKIVALSELDIKIKSGKIDKYLGIELFMLEI